MSFLDALISAFTFWDEDDMRKARKNVTDSSNQ